MDICVFGLNHKTAPVGLRERFSISPEKTSEVLREMLNEPSVEESLYLGTCNRSEIYCVSHNADLFKREVETFINRSIVPEFSLETYKDHYYMLVNEETVRHAFHVCSALDSMVLGENEILGQAKDAFVIASHHAGTTGKYLNKLFLSAFECAKRVKTETDISRIPVSIGHIAVELAKKVFDDFNSANVLLVGSGHMARIILEHLKGFGVRNLTIANRTIGNAEKLKEEVEIQNARICNLDNLNDKISESDIVISSVESASPIITADEVKRLKESRPQRPLFFIDIGVPRSIEPAIHDIRGVFLFDIDDMEKIKDSGYERRKTEAEKGRKIAFQDVLKYLQWIEMSKVDSTITSLRRHFENVRKQELSRFEHRFDHLDGKDREHIDYLTKSIINKILHNPMVSLKNKAVEERGREGRLKTMMDFLTDLFRL